MLLVASLLFLPADASGQRVHNIWEIPLKHGIAAEVEGQIITFHELRREMAPLIPRLKEESRTAAEFNQRLNELYIDVLGNLVDRILIVGRFRELGREIPQTYVKTEVGRIFIERYGGDRHFFLEDLQAQGKTVSDFRREVEEDIIVDSMRREALRDIPIVSPERIEEFYARNRIHFYQEESVKLRLIYLHPYGDEGAEHHRENARKVLAELEVGADFSDLARRYSQDPSATEGGDWGWINRSDLREELVRIAFSLQSGHWSDIVELDGSLYILYVEDRVDEGIQPLDQVRDRIEAIVSQQIRRQNQERWLEQLRADAFVRYF